MAIKRTRLTRNETMEAMRFVADVAALKADPSAQRQVLIDGVLRMGGADSGFGYFARDWRVGGAPRLTTTTVAAGSNEIFATYVRDVIQAGGGVDADPYCTNTLPRDASLVSVSRRDVVPDRKAERQFEAFVDWGGLSNLGDGHICFARLDAAAVARAPGGGKVSVGDMVGVGIHRMDGGRHPFAARDRALVRLVIAECAGLVARGHMAPPDEAASADPAAGLAPRPREVLQRILRGQTPKTIAHAMGIGVYTVREYLQTLYRDFDVNGRDELMAKFVRA